MHDITEHDTKEEGESHTSEDSRVDFLESWDTISVDDLLEGPGEFIGLEEGRLNESSIILH